MQPTELAFIDQLAAIDGLTARRDALDERLSRLAQDPRVWPTVARLRCFRGIDTITALMLHLELGGDWQRFGSPRKLAGWLGLTPSLEQSGETANAGFDLQDRLRARPPAAGRVRLALHAPTRDRRHAHNRQAGQPDHVLQIAWRAQHRLHRVHHRIRERGKPAQRRHRRRRPRTGRLPLGRRHRAMT